MYLLLKNSDFSIATLVYWRVNQQVMEFGVGHGSYKWGNWGYSPTYRRYEPHFVTGRGPPFARFLPGFFWMLPKIQVDPKKKVSPSHGRLQCPYRSPPRMLLDQLSDCGFSKEN